MNGALRKPGSHCATADVTPSPPRTTSSDYLRPRSIMNTRHRYLRSRTTTSIYPIPSNGAYLEPSSAPTHIPGPGLPHIIGFGFWNPVFGGTEMESLPEFSYRIPSRFNIISSHPKPTFMTSPRSRMRLSILRLLAPHRCRYPCDTEIESLSEARREFPSRNSFSSSCFDSSRAPFARPRLLASHRIPSYRIDVR